LRSRIGIKENEMGYTHYFSYDPNAESFITSWTKMVDDARAIAEHIQKKLGIQLTSAIGEDAPELTEALIGLNGPVLGDLWYESLIIDPAPWKIWDEEAARGNTHWAEGERREFEERGRAVAAFCKTARKPYDIAVTSILLRCRHLAPDAFVIGSDGDWENEWQHGAMYWQKGCEIGVSPVELVKTLFGQEESIGATRLLTMGEVESGPPSARARRGVDATLRRKSREVTRIARKVS
jgi:hypothetical protein